MRLVVFIILATVSVVRSEAQWEIEESHTTASLRGITNVGGGVAWASGTGGTVLRTEDGGYLWQTCAVPPGAEKLDFRGVQAFDENTAIVMSSGPGDQSRLYKTTDGCQTWKLLFTNPDKDGFWDAIQITLDPSYRTDGKRFHSGRLIGDPVDGKFVEFTWREGETWVKETNRQAGMPTAKRGEALFAASNSVLLYTVDGQETFVTGGVSGSRSRVLSEYVKHDPRVSWKYIGGEIPLARGESAGAFSVATSLVRGERPDAPANRDFTVMFFPRDATCVTVGGDFKKPDTSDGTAAFTIDGGQHWAAARTPPHGYRSAVAYDSAAKLWITVGPNGTDISTDDGRNWRPLIPTAQDDRDADKNWNALSLPFVVGPHGRIGRLRTNALPPSTLPPATAKDPKLRNPQ